MKKVIKPKLCYLLNLGLYPSYGTDSRPFRIFSLGIKQILIYAVLKKFSGYKWIKNCFRNNQEIVSNILKNQQKQSNHF